MYKVNGELFSCDITDSGRVPSREGDIQNFGIISSLERIIQICSNFYWNIGFLKLLSTHPIHIVVWGNLPFKCFKVKVKIDKWPDLSWNSFLPIACCAVLEWWAWPFIQHTWWYSVIDILNFSNFKTFVFLAVYWSIWTSSWLHNYYISKFKNFF